MKVDKLSPKEFELLSAIDDGFTPDSRYSVAIAASEGQEIVGRIFLVSPVHVEGPWIAPEHRGGTIAKRLMDTAEKEARAAGVKKLMAYGANDEIEGYLKRLGFEQVRLTVWVKEL